MSALCIYGFLVCRFVYNSTDPVCHRGWASRANDSRWHSLSTMAVVDCEYAQPAIVPLQQTKSQRETCRIEKTPNIGIYMYLGRCFPMPPTHSGCSRQQIYNHPWRWPRKGAINVRGTPSPPSLLLLLPVCCCYLYHASMKWLMKVSSHFLYHLSLSLFPSLNFSLLWHFAKKKCDALASIPTIRNHSPHNLIPDFLYQFNCLAIIPIIQANTVLLIFISALFISVHEFRPMAGHIAELPFLIGKRFSALRYKSHLTRDR